MSRKRTLLLAIAAVAATPNAGQAWDIEGHRIVAQLALDSLKAGGGPADFPAFVFGPDEAERIAYLANEPDRWRNVADLALQQANGLDHYLDMEELADAGLDAGTVSPLRYVFALEFAAGRAAHPDRFEVIDPARNRDHTREWPGFLPWAVSESYSRLKSSFNTLRTFEAYGGTPTEIANARAEVVDVMGVMAHYVGDSAQPLHTTIHHHGWVGPNPSGYSTWAGIHSYIDGGFIAQAHITRDGAARTLAPAAEIHAASPGARDAVFAAEMDFLGEQNRQVVPLYEMFKSGIFNPAKGAAIRPEAVAFIESQLAKGGHMLGSVWLSAWRQSAPDPYLRAILTRRAESARVSESTGRPAGDPSAPLPPKAARD